MGQLTRLLTACTALAAVGAALAAPAMGQEPASRPARPDEPARAGEPTFPRADDGIVTCSGWQSADVDKYDWGHVTNQSWLHTGPYSDCALVWQPGVNTKVWYHCYVVNVYGNQWTHARIAGTDISGWISSSALDNYGSRVRCSGNTD